MEINAEKLSVIFTSAPISITSGLIQSFYLLYPHFKIECLRSNLKLHICSGYRSMSYFKYIHMVIFSPNISEA